MIDRYHLITSRKSFGNSSFDTLPIASSRLDASLLLVFAMLWNYIHNIPRDKMSVARVKIWNRFSNRHI